MWFYRRRKNSKINSPLINCLCKNSSQIVQKLNCLNVFLFKFFFFFSHFFAAFLKHVFHTVVDNDPFSWMSSSKINFIQKNTKQ